MSKSKFVLYIFISLFIVSFLSSKTICSKLVACFAVFMFVYSSFACSLVVVQLLRSESSPPCWPRSGAYQATSISQKAQTCSGIGTGRASVFQGFGLCFPLMSSTRVCVALLPFARRRFALLSCSPA